MEQYISKSDVVAWIKNRFLPTVNPNSDEWEMGADAERVNILNLINSLEVKEVDLEKEIDKVWDTDYEDFGISAADFYRVTRYFFELGLKAQK